MRTKNLILSIILVALTANASGQFSEIRDRLFPNKSEKVEILTTEYSYENSLAKDLMNDLLSLRKNIITNDELAEPAVIESYTFNHVTINYDEQSGVESWMTEPFESSEEVAFENWMGEPFETGEEVAFEKWMAEPFENTEVPVLENWMAEPFDYSEGIEIEPWMTSSWI